MRKSRNGAIVFATLVVVWAGCFGLSVRAGWLYAPFYTPFDTGASRATDGALLGFQSAVTPDEAPAVRFAAPASPVEVGDRLLAIDGRPALGLSQNEIFTRLTNAALASPDHSITLELSRGSKTKTATLRYRSHPFWWPEPLVSCFFIATGVAFFWKVRDPGQARRSGLFLATSAIYLSGSFWGEGELSFWHAVTRSLTVSLLFFLSLRFALFFPYRKPRGRVLHWLLPAILAVADLTRALIWQFELLPAPIHVVRAFESSTGAIWATALLSAVAYNYFHAQPSEKRQIKWVVMGFSVTLTMWLAGYLVYVGLEASASTAPFIGNAFDGMHVYQAIGTVMLVSAPAGAIVSVFFFRSIDVDPLISGTTSITLLAAGLFGFMVFLMPSLAQLVGDLFGIETKDIERGLTITTVALAIPLHQKVRLIVDNWLRRGQLEFEKRLGDLMASFARFESVRELAESCGSELRKLTNASSLAVYTANNDDLELIFGAGPGIPKTFHQQGSALLATLREREQPLTVHHEAELGAETSLSHFDRATLDTLGAQVVVPVRFAGALRCILCLGGKESGDVYLRSEVHLLSALASTLGTHLELLDQQAIAREATAMRQDLQQYVPGSIRKQLEKHADLAPRECAVTVLFVDIRGYARLSEGMSSPRVFSLINRYTQTVSQAIEAFSGSVVEFNGDGMMAVFGAPEALENREAAAVRAGQKILEDLRRLAADPAGDAGRVEVGIGIATGAAMVGSVESADRRIWTALGDTTNLAARLESLTRDLQVSMVVDQGTYRAAGEAAHEMELRPQVPIRGREKREDVYTLPLFVGAGRAAA